MDIADFSFFCWSRLASNCGYAERLVDQNVRLFSGPNDLLRMAMYWAIKISNNAILLFVLSELFVNDISWG